MAQRRWSSDQRKELLDVIITEWSECRRTIRSFDHILTHIRSYSILATISLLSLGSLISFISTARGLVIDVLALVLVPFEYHLERHYESYLRAAAARAGALEGRIQRFVPGLDRIRVGRELGGNKRNQMISELISYYAQHKAVFWKTRAHQLLYFFLAVVDASVIIATVFLEVSIIWGIGVFAVACVVFLWIVKHYFDP